MSLWEKQSIFSYNLSFLVQEINRRGLHAVIGEVERAPQLAALYAKEGKGIVDSLHCKKLAADIHLFNDKGEWIQDFKIYQPFGLFWESLDKKNRWGGFFVSKYKGKMVDMDHFEMQDL